MVGPEKLDGLIRDFYPRGTNLNRFTDAEIGEMQRVLNIRPWKTLAFRIQGERVGAFIVGVVLTT